MEYVAYNYFETPDETGLEKIGLAFMHPDFGISHAGKNDPPKKFSGNELDLCALVKQGTNLTNYTFLKGRNNKLEVTIEIHNDPRWEHSTFSISGSSKEAVENLCVSLNNVVNSYLCISGVLEQGACQEWLIIHRSTDCPQMLLSQVSNA